MWKRIMGWIKEVLGLLRKDIEPSIHGVIGSDAMDAAQESWRLAFANKPPWLTAGTVTTKFPGFITSYIATLCSSEIMLSCGTGHRAEWVQEQIDRFVISDIRNQVQKASALSFVALKPYVDGNNIYCDVNTPETFFPTSIRGGVILGGVFADLKYVKHGSKDTAYVRLEEHSLEAYGVRITNRAYKADNIKQGAEVPLSTVDAWSMLQDDVFVLNINRPLFAILKMPFANQIDTASALPVSAYANAMESFEKIDRIYNDFLWEVESARRKQIFDITAVRNADGETARITDLRHYKTTDQYLVLDMGTSEKPYDDYTPDIRVDDYQTALNIQIRLLELQVGISAGTFNFDVKSGLARAKTATEVLSDDNETYNTIKSIQENGLKQGLEDLIAIYDIYASLYNLAPSGSISPAVEFGDSIFEDTGTEYLRRKALADSDYIDKWRVVAWYFGVSEEEAKKMVPAQTAPDGIFGQNAFAAGEDGI